MVEFSTPELYQGLEANSDEDLLASTGPEYKDVILHFLYDRYEKRIFYKAKSILNDSHETKDLCNEISIKIFTKLKQFK